MPTQQKTAYIHALTGMRGLAAWWVVFYHFREYSAAKMGPGLTQFFDYGYLAVDLFFVLSGFVIYYNYQHIFDRIDRHRLWAFISARIARIYPLHLFIILLYLANPLAIMLFSEAKIMDPRYDPLAYVMSLFLVQNWGFLDRLTWNIPAWSISTEMFAYLMFPPMVLVIKRLCNGLLSTLAFMALGLLLVVVLFAGLGLSNLGEKIPQVGVWRCVLEFFVGMVVCHLYLTMSETTSRVLKIVAPIVFLAACAGFTFSGLPDYLLMPISFAALVLSMTYGYGPVNMLLANPVMLYIGEISYSTYLVHYFAKDWTRFLLVSDPDNASWLAITAYLTGTLVLSVILYHQIEKPFRWRFKRLLMRKPA